MKAQQLFASYLNGYSSRIPERNCEHSSRITESNYELTFFNHAQPSIYHEHQRRFALGIDHERQHNNALRSLSFKFPIHKFNARIHQKTPRTAVIASSVVSACVLAGFLLLLFLWSHRRRRRGTHDNLEVAEQYNVTSPELALTYQKLADEPSARSDEPVASQNIARLLGTTEPEHFAVPPTDPGELMALRLQRVEAQLEGLLSSGLHPAPPSYYSGDATE
ncbi:hypothetical protein C8R45DRAFT_1110321 [Mycena sanguinolenta]|nr:hypothetical protein C8R45DRAFT_1110321 [Mycena sanguinolenta]